MSSTRAHVGDRVREVDQLQPEGAGLHLLPRRQLLQRRVAELVLVELGADHPDRQQAAVDHRRRADLAQHVGQRADVVLVAVGEDDRLDVVGALAQVGEVGQDQVDAEHLGGREHQPGVDDDDPAVVLDHGHVLADLPQPAEREDAKLLAATRLARRRPSGRRASSAALTTARCASSSADHRQPQRAGGDRPGISSAAFTGIGLVVTDERRRRAAAGSASISRARSMSPACAASHISRICGPTRCEATRMPPAAADLQGRRKMSSLPARTASPSIGPSSSLLACLTATTLSICASSASSLGRDVDDHPRGDVVEDQRGRAPPRRSPRSGPEARPVRLVVVRGDDQRRVGAGLGRRLGQLDRVTGVVGAGAADDRRLVADLVDHRPQQRRCARRRRGSGPRPWSRRRRARGSRSRPGCAASRRAAASSTAPTPSNGVTIAVSSPRISVIAISVPR